MNTNARVLLSGAAALALVGLSGSARAATFGDSHGSLSGAACRKVGTAGTLAIEADGSIYNNTAAGGSTLTVECPVASNGTGWVTFVPSSLVYVDNVSSTITCSLRAEAADSAAVNTLNVASSGASPTLREFDLSNLQTFVDGHAHVRCTIPPKDSANKRSYIVGYLVYNESSNDPLGNRYHNFTGNNCRQIGTLGAVGLTNDGTIFNDLDPGGALLTVDCPIMTARDGATSLSRTKVWWIDASSSALSCTLRAEAADSTAVSTRTLTSTFDDNTNYHSFTFSGSNAITTFTDGYAHLRCSIPARDASGFASHIVGYALEH